MCLSSCVLHEAPLGIGRSCRGRQQAKRTWALRSASAPVGAAGRGRPPQAAARRPALRRVEEVVTGQREKRTDRPCPASGTTAVRTVGVRHMRTGWSCGHADVRGDRTPWTGVRPPTVRRPPARTRSGPCGSRRGQGNARGAQPDTRPEPPLPPATAAAKPAEHVGVRSAWPPRPPRGEQERTCRRRCRTRPLRPSGMPSRFRTPADMLPRPLSAGGVRWLRELVAGVAAAGGMQPAPVRASQPGG
jgi:hypothetical protein